jgi:hypothetical protein
VFEFDSDGYAEVAIRVANSINFGDGKNFNNGKNDIHQYTAILYGRAGALRAFAPLPTHFIAHDPPASKMAAGFFDGKTSHLVGFLENRLEDKALNIHVMA